MRSACTHVMQTQHCCVRAGVDRKFTDVALLGRAQFGLYVAYRCMHNTPGQHLSIKSLYHCSCLCSALADALHRARGTTAQTNLRNECMHQQAFPRHETHTCRVWCCRKLCGCGRAMQMPSQEWESALKSLNARKKLSNALHRLCGCGHIVHCPWAIWQVRFLCHHALTIP